MAQAQGWLGQLAFQVESTYGVTPTAPDMKKIYIKSESLREADSLETSQVLRGSRNAIKPVRGNRDVSGSISTELSPQMGTLLKACLGANTTTGGGSPYTHTMKVGALSSFTLEKGFTDIGAYLLFNGCKVSRLSIAVTPAGYQDVTIDWQGANEAQILKYDAQSGAFTVGLTVTGGTSSATGVILADDDDGTTGILTLVNVTGTFVNDEAITDTSTGAAVANGGLGVALDTSVTDPGHTPFGGFDVASITIGGVAVANVKSVNITVENNLDGDSFIVGGRGRRASLTDGIVKVSGDITVLFTDMTLYQKAIAGTESSLYLKWALGTGAGTSGNETLEISIPELIWAKETPVLDGPRGVEYRGTFSAYYDNDAGASDIILTLKNASSTI